MEGRLYSAVTIKCNHKEKYVDISMTGYIEKSLRKFQHSSPFFKNNGPHQWRRTQYGARMQYALDSYTTSELYKYENPKIQKIVGTLLYYYRAIYLNILKALNVVTEQKSKSV